jgi:hypothetical protein
MSQTEINEIKHKTANIVYFFREQAIPIMLPKRLLLVWMQS